jgi:hypothetical protein
MRSILLIALPVTIVLLEYGPTLASPCDTELSPSPNAGVEAYRERDAGNRCEGMYVSPVSGTPVELVSLTRGPFQFDNSNPPVLSVALDAHPPDDAAHVRAVGIPERLYYQMDADVAGGNAVRWPVAEVLARSNIKPSQVGVFAFRRNASAETVFLPVTVVAEGSMLVHEHSIIVVLRVINVAKLEYRFVSNGQVVLLPYAPATVDGDRAEIVLLSQDGPLAGKLEIRWIEPGTGESRPRTFLVGN